jgi:rhombotail lipoprotein
MKRTHETTTFTTKPNMKLKKFTAIGLGTAAAVALLATGCETFHNARTDHQASSLYAYLYPDKNNHIETPSIPVLSLPLRVGVAFVPGNDQRQRHLYGYVTDDLAISESQKIGLMKQISAQFKKYPFVQSVDLIPTVYLTPGGSFANLDQIRTMYGVDVMALVSYDQVQFTGEGWWSVTYWTVAGALVVPGEKNETRTMLDAAVFDIDSRKMLFRAPGIGDVKDSATLVTLDEQLHENSQLGFNKAAADLTTNLQAAIAEFQSRVTNSVAQTKALGTNAPVEYKVAYKAGYAGGGALGGTETALLAGMGICFVWTLRNARKNKA